MVTSECFFDKPLWKFIGMMWWPHCLNCTGAVETILVDSMRLAIKLASYPILTDLIHSALATRVHYLRKNRKIPVCRKADGKGWETCDTGVYDPNKDPETRCSDRSTRFRDDEVRMFKIIAKKLAEAADLLDYVMVSYDSFVTKILAAGPDNPNIVKSKELSDFWDSLDSELMTYLKQPPERVLSLAGNERSYGKWKELAKKSKEKLLNECKEIPSCSETIGRTFYTKQEVVNRLSRALDKATPLGQFGTCSDDHDCEAVAQGLRNTRECKCRKKGFLFKVRHAFSTNRCPRLTGLCRCKKGFRFKKDGEDITCVVDTLKEDINKDVSDANRSSGFKRLRKLVQSWVLRRELELGSAKKVLERLMTSSQN